MKKLVIGLTIVVVATAGYLAWQHYYPVQPVSSPTLDATAGWKTYTNTDRGYSFKYPPAWNAINGSSKGFSEFGVGGVDVFPNTSSIEAFMQSVQATYSNKQNVTVDGISAISVDYDGPTGQPDFGRGVMALKDGNLYNIYLNSHNPQDIITFNLLLSTFKFTGSALSEKTYTNTNPGFIIQYPTDWAPTVVSANTQQGQVNLAGSTGKVSIYWGGGFGGGVCPATLTTVQVNSQSAKLCFVTNSDGSASLVSSGDSTTIKNSSGIDFDFTGKGSDKNSLIQILSTFKFTK